MYQTSFPHKLDSDLYLLHQYNQEEFIWGFGLDKQQKIFITPNNLELEILVDQVKPNPIKVQRLKP
jgi:hypothetical protein